MMPDKRLIDANALVDKVRLDWGLTHQSQLISATTKLAAADAMCKLLGEVAKCQTINAVDVVRCRDCIYMEGLETAKRVLSAMESKAELVRHTELTRGDGETRVILMHHGIYAVYGDERLLGRCERCQHVNLLNADYCNGCGAKVDSWREKGDDE